MYIIGVGWIIGSTNKLKNYLPIVLTGGWGLGATTNSATGGWTTGLLFWTLAAAWLGTNSPLFLNLFL